MNYTPLALLMLVCTSFFYPGYQRIKLDDKYNNVQPKGAPKPLHYKIKAGNGLILDCSNYDFSAIKKMNHDKFPDAIHLICKSGSFDIPLNTAGETTIDASSVQPLDSGKVFKGFEKGDHIIMGIGTTQLVEVKTEMLTYWVALMDVE